MDWLIANKVAVLGALLAVSECLSLIPALKGNGILDTAIKGIQALLNAEKR